jgi:hypothetical protein
MVTGAYKPTYNWGHHIVLIYNLLFVDEVYLDMEWVL